MACSEEDILIRNTTCWDKVEGYLTCEQPPVPVKERWGWKTVRIFVSSTFKDFHSERDVLVKKVFPDLRMWCQMRKLHLVECDLRWGVPYGTPGEHTVKICLEELDRCYKENQNPFFLNMTSQRIGWIPDPKTLSNNGVSQELLEHYKLVFGFSVTEMEIFHGAYRIENPHAMFLIRLDSFYKTLPTEDTKEIKSAHEGYAFDDYAKEKLPILRRKLKDRFHKERFITYEAVFSHFNEDKKAILTIIDEDEVTQNIISFFKTKIHTLYPPPETSLDKFTESRLAHETFMELKAETVLGREDVLKQIERYINTGDNGVPLLLLGEAGTGKSSIMAKAAHNAKLQAPTQRAEDVYVFYHFVGAVPGSTALLAMLQRLLKELTNITEKEVPNDLDTAVQTTYSVLTHCETRSVVIFIDALNQFDENHPSVNLMNWVPRELSHRVQCVFSMIPDTPQHRHLLERTIQPKTVMVEDLDKNAKEEIVEKFFQSWTKELDNKQMECLLKKTCSVNPLWLTIACEELRVHGNFRTMDDLTKIKALGDDLFKLIEQVLDRFEKESSGSERLIKATLCFIEVSRMGLLESELYYILGDYDNTPAIDQGEQEKGLLENREKGRYTDEDRLPTYKWTNIIRALGPLLRPFGELGEGRLDFYHRAFSKAVRNKYNLSNDRSNRRNWHSLLADYFQLSQHAHAETALDRMVEEYPYHLVQLDDHERLKEFLSDWKAFDKLYKTDYSFELIDYWKKCASFQCMRDCYEAKINDEKDQPQKIARYEQVGRVLLQCGESDSSLQLAEIGLKLVNAKDKSTLAGYYTLLTDIYDSKYKNMSLSADSVPIAYEALKYSKKSVDILKDLEKKDNHYKKLYGRYLTKHAMNHGSLSDSLKYLVKPEKATKEKYTPESAVKDGHTYVDKAIKLFQQMNDKGLLAEAMQAKGNLYRRKFPDQIKWLKDAHGLCKEAYGLINIKMGRIYRNMATAYSEHNDFKTAYDYYIKCYELYKELLGPDHVDTKTSKKVLQEQFYVDRFGVYTEQ